MPRGGLATAPTGARVSNIPPLPPLRKNTDEALAPADLDGVPPAGRRRGRAREVALPGRDRTEPRRLAPGPAAEGGQVPRRGPRERADGLRRRPRGGPRSLVLDQSRRGHVRGAGGPQVPTLPDRLVPRG